MCVCACLSGLMVKRDAWFGLVWLGEICRMAYFGNYVCTDK